MLHLYRHLTFPVTSDVPVCFMSPIGDAIDVLDAMDVDWQSNNCLAACSEGRFIVGSLGHWALMTQLDNLKDMKYVHIVRERCTGGGGGGGEGGGLPKKGVFDNTNVYLYVLGVTCCNYHHYYHSGFIILQAIVYFQTEVKRISWDHRAELLTSCSDRSLKVWRMYDICMKTHRCNVHSVSCNDHQYG